MARRLTGPAGGVVYSLKNSTSTGAATGASLGNAYGVFGIQIDSTGISAKLQGSIDGTNYTDIGSTAAWSTSQAANSIVQVQSSAPVTHVRLSVNSNNSTAGASGSVAVLPSVST